MVTRVLPWLARLVGDPTVSSRDGILEWIADHGRLDPALRPAGWSAAWRAARPALLAALDDEDEELIPSVALALGSVPDPDVALVDAVWAHATTGGHDVDGRRALMFAAVDLDADRVRDRVIELAELGDLDALLTARRAGYPGWSAPEPIVAAIRAVDGPVEQRVVYGWRHNLVRAVAADLGDARDLVPLLIDDPQPGYRLGAVDTAANATLLSRAAWPGLAADLAHRIDLGDPECCGIALHVLAALGALPADRADTVAGLLDDPRGFGYSGSHRLAVVAAWALAAIDDERGLAAIDGWLARREPGWHWYGVSGADGSYSLTNPSIREIIGPLRRHAARWLPAVQRRLGVAAHTAEVNAFAEVCQAWGPDAAAAAKDLVPGLRSAVAPAVADALAAIGPAAAGPAQRRLRWLARGSHAPSRMAAVAALVAIGARPPGLIRKLARDLASGGRNAALAAGYVARFPTGAGPLVPVLRTLRDDATAAPARVAAAYALAHLGENVDAALDVLIEAADAALHGKRTQPTYDALALALTLPGDRTAALADRLAATDRPVGAHDDWRTLFDDRAVRTLTAPAGTPATS